MKKAQATTIVIIVLLVTIIIIGVIIAVNLSNKPITTGQVVKENTNPSNILNTQKNDETIKYENKEYRLKCIRNCDRGLDIYDQVSDNNEIAITLKNKNPRECDMWCYFDYGEVIVRNDNSLSKRLLTIDYNKKESYRIRIDDIQKFKLFCAEGGRYGSTTQVEGCEVVIKQIFNLEEI